MDWSAVEQALDAAAYSVKDSVTEPSACLRDFRERQCVFPGAVLLVGRSGEVLFEKSVGFRSLIPELTPIGKQMVFDVASLTKVIVTTTLAMQFVEAGHLSLDRRLSRVFQSFGTLGKDRITVRHLLNHTSGYAATYPFFRMINKASQGKRTGVLGTKSAAELVYQEIFRAKLDNLPGKVAVYSDIGFMLLGRALEVLSGGISLDRLAIKHVIAPLGLRSTGFVDLTKLKTEGLVPVTRDMVPTAECPWRKGILCGEVHDDNAWAMGGVAGHAGLFSTAEDVHRFASEMIACWKGEGSLVSQETIREFWTRDQELPNSTWALGWDTRNDDGSSSGKYFSASSVGHLAFTGCSLWIDPEREIDVVLLSNRIHPDPVNDGIKAFRPLIHDLVMETLGYNK